MTASATEQRRTYLKSFDFRGLFINGLGWDHYERRPECLDVDGEKYFLTPVAEKAGFVVFECQPQPKGTIPPYPVRRKIEQRVARIAYEHLIVFTDSRRKSQKWQWVKREQGNSPKCRERTYFTGLSGEPILQQLERIAFTLKDEAKGIGISDVTSRVIRAWDVENVTRRFYERFKTELITFRDFIDGISEQGDRDWYASLMLNRMMFIYFVQKRGFLDGNPDYLRNRLKKIQEGSGEGHFHDFYRLFLLRLFHEGLGQPEAQRDPSLALLLGKVPFLNGGLFDVHDLERSNIGIRIPDEAFKRVFDFFDEYHWHLDERPHRADNEINPDVLGYIFEKFINQKQMGAYYTKEDITGYISRNTLIPHLFATARDECPIAFRPDGGVFRILRDDPDRYIYPAVGHGMSWDAGGEYAPRRLKNQIELPNLIKRGVEDVSQRTEWDDPAPYEFALPTETWQEVVARRQRYEDVRAKLESGTVRGINDLITLNLDIELFAHDVIAQSEGPELVRAFWHALRKVSILDPTCGSGAFLFAALNILEPLYTTCLEAMGGFLEDLENTKRPHHSQALQDFRAIRDQVKGHSSERYFILKSIVLNNLYGVDIMEEAVEICKLRLFLKLVAQLENYDEIEPLPDIDFNIRAGNTLVGFASLEEVKLALQTDLVKQLDLSDIENRAEAANRAFRKFRGMQTNHDISTRTFAHAKLDLRERLDGLRAELDACLAGAFGVSIEDEKAYGRWRDSHQPFHWFVEFHGIMHGGGFDVIIGNPPYVTYPSKHVSYSLEGLGYRTLPTKNLYGVVFERCVALAGQSSPVGLIVQLTCLSSGKLSSLQEILLDRGMLHASAFPRRPKSIFEGVEMPVAILLSTPTPKQKLFTTKICRFYDREKAFFINEISYCEHSVVIDGHRIAKFGKAIDTRIYRRLSSFSGKLGGLASNVGKGTLHYQEACRYWAKAANKQPFYRKNGMDSTPPHWRSIRMISREAAAFATCVLNSSLFFWYYSAFSDCEHINDGLVRRFPIPEGWNRIGNDWEKLCSDLVESLETNAKRKSISTKQGHTIEYDEISGAASKVWIDLIDATLAGIYNLSDEEFDYIVQYDIKYRVGLESAALRH